MRGIVAAGILGRRGLKTTLVERHHALGGVMCSEPWGDLYIDKGCHLLDMGHTGSAELYTDILGQAMHPVERSYASWLGNARSDDMAVPDFSAGPPDLLASALDDIRTHVSAAPSLDTTDMNGATLTQAFAARFGRQVGNIMAQCAKKMTAIEPDELDATALATLPLLARCRLGSDDDMMRLKRSDSALDARLAVSSAYLTRVATDGAAALAVRNRYPSQRGMRGLCDAALRWLAEECGVDVLTRTVVEDLRVHDDGIEATLSGSRTINARHLYWAQAGARFLTAVGDEDPARGTSRPVSMALYAFKVKPSDVLDITYIHDFRPETVAFRHSSAGIYGRQYDADGLTYVCVEVPCTREQPAWTDPEPMSHVLWSEAQAVGLIKRNARFEDFQVERAPVTIVLPAVGSGPSLSQRDEALAHYENRVLFSDRAAFGKAAIVDAVTEDLDNFERQDR